MSFHTQDASLVPLVSWHWLVGQVGGAMRRKAGACENLKLQN